MPDTRSHPRTAADWRAVQSALLVDAECWNALADQVIVQPGLPRLLADDYAIAVGRGYRAMAQAAQDAADQAGLYAQDAPTAVAS